MSPASQASEIGGGYRDVFLCAAATGVDGWKGASEGTIVALHFLVHAGGMQNACALTAVGVWQFGIRLLSIGVYIVVNSSFGWLCCPYEI